MMRIPSSVSGPNCGVFCCKGLPRTALPVAGSMSIMTLVMVG